jgi:hypothetical protein
VGEQALVTSCIEPVAVPPSANKDSDEQGTPAYPCRNPAIINAVLACAVAGQGQIAIGQALGISQSTVSRILSSYRPTLELSRKRLEAGALQAAEDWIEASANGAKQGNHKPAKELLQAVGVVQQDASSINQTLVVVADGDTPIGPAPTFASEASALTVDMHRPSGDVGSDNPRYVATNETAEGAEAGQPVTGGSALDPTGPISPAAVCGMEPEDLRLDTGQG